MGTAYDVIQSVAAYALPALTAVILLLCFSPLLRRRQPPLGQACLVDVSTGEAFELNHRETSIGSGKKCDIVLDYESVSALQAVVICTKKGWHISGALLGADIIVNGKKVEGRAVIADGDRITVGGVALVFEHK